MVVDRKTLSRIFFLVMGTVGQERSCRAGITKRLNEALPHRYYRSHHHRAAAGGTAGPGCGRVLPDGRAEGGGASYGGLVGEQQLLHLQQRHDRRHHGRPVAIAMNYISFHDVMFT